MHSSLRFPQKRGCWFGAKEDATHATLFHLRGMSSQKRVSLSPSCVGTLKRSCAVSGGGNDLQCLVCHELVVDATQVTCCGALHCRSCISRCPTCPNCRKPLSSKSIIPDVRCERLSAAHHRPCLYKDHGCKFEGNRISVESHELLCEFVPRSVLREKIKTLDAIIAAKDQETEEDLRAVAEQVEDEFLPVLQKQKALMKSALGHDPAKGSLRVLYGFAPNVHILRMKREDSHNEREHENPLPVVLKWDVISGSNSWTQSISFRVVERNHNVAIYFARNDDSATIATPYNPVSPTIRPLERSFQQGQRLKVMLLHPYAVDRAKVISFDLTKLNSLHQHGILNFMTSAELDKFSVDGHYFFCLAPRFHSPLLEIH